MTKHTFYRYMRYAIGIALIPIFIYLGSITVKLVQGVSLSEKLPEYTMRLQVLDMTKSTVSIGKVKNLVGLCEDSELIIDIIDFDSMTVQSIDSTFVIGRSEDLAGPKLLASRLGLNSEDVIYRPLENNRAQITATLVLGEDLDSIRTRLTKKKKSKK